MRHGVNASTGVTCGKIRNRQFRKKPFERLAIVGVDFSHGVAGRWGPGTRRVLWRSSFQNFRIVLHINARKVSSVWRRNRWCLCAAGERINNVRPHVDGGWFGWWIHNSRQDVMWIVWRANSQCSIAYGWWMVWKTNLTILKDRVDTGWLEGQLMMLHTECWMDWRRIDDDRQRVWMADWLEDVRSINHITIFPDWSKPRIATGPSVEIELHIRIDEPKCGVTRPRRSQIWGDFATT